MLIACSAMISGVRGPVLLSKKTLIRMTRNVMIPNTGLSLNVTATLVNTFLIFLCFIVVSCTCLHALSDRKCFLKFYSIS